MLLALAPLSTALAVSSTLLKAEHMCLKYPTIEARADCQRREKESQAAFDKAEAQALRDKGWKKEGAGDKAKGDLCFTRAATGERVCPN